MIIETRAFARAGKEINENTKKVALLFDLKGTNILSSAIEGILQGSYKFTKYKTDKQKNNEYDVTVFSKSINEKILARESTKARNLTEAVNLARDIVNEPPVYLTPSKLADISETVAEEGKLEIKILGKEETCARIQAAIDNA